MSDTHIKPAGDNAGDSNWLEVVRQQVSSLRYGVVEIVVHDSRVTQIEKTERVRLDKPQPKSR
jgi:hypothetical protein